MDEISEYFVRRSSCQLVQHIAVRSSDDQGLPYRTAALGHDRRYGGASGHQQSDCPGLIYLCIEKQAVSTRLVSRGCHTADDLKPGMF
jgi:hypothetical protein